MRSINASSTPPARPVRTGFTLIELVIAIAVLAILVVLAVPSFELIRNTSLLATGSNDLVAGMQTARTEAVRRGVPVAICSSANGSTCAGGTGPWQGWLVYADVNRSGGLDGPDIAIQAGSFNTRLTVTPTAAITGNGNAITYRPDGLARGTAGVALLQGNLAVCLPTTRPAENRRVVSLVSGGRVSTQSNSSGGTCP